MTEIFQEDPEPAEKKDGVLFLLVPSHSSFIQTLTKPQVHFKRYSKKEMNSLELPANIKW